MASINIEHLRQDYPGMTDEEIAFTIAKEYGYHAVVRYKAFGSKEFTDFSVCYTQLEMQGYLGDHKLGAELLYNDGMALTDEGINARAMAMIEASSRRKKWWQVWK